MAARRSRVLGVVLIVLAAVALGVVLWRATDDESPGSADVSAPSTECLDMGGQIDTVEQLDKFARTVRGSAAFAGGDVGASTQLQDGRQLFVFGDTLRNDEFQGDKFVRNSMLVVSKQCGQVVLPEDGGAIIPNRSDGVGYWPMSVVRIEFQTFDLIGISAQRVRSTDDKDAGVFAFEILGPSLATFVVPRGQTPQLVDQVDIGPDKADPSRPMWGAATAYDAPWVYVYGTARPADATVGGFALRVARVRPADVLRTDEWRYWDGRSWQRDASKAAVLIPNEGGVSQTLSVFQQGKRWYAVSKRDEVLGTDLTLWRAPSPTGPFKVLDVAAEIPSDAATGTLRYLPLAHPELLPEPGTVVVSYSQNNTDFQAVEDDPRIYRPRFLRVSLQPE
jgi:uncharacterized protein DUF4185